MSDGSGGKSGNPAGQQVVAESDGRQGCRHGQRPLGGPGEGAPDRGQPVFGELVVDGETPRADTCQLSSHVAEVDVRLVGVATWDLFGGSVASRARPPEAVRGALTV